MTEKDQKHTPEPWTLHREDGAGSGGGGYRIDAGGQTQITFVWDRGTELPSGVSVDYFGSCNSLADARLIVAAPRLLAACRTTLRELTDMTTERFACGGDSKVRALLAAVIVEATLPCSESPEEGP